MRKAYIRLEHFNNITIQVNPFTEKDVFNFFDLESNIIITCAYIRIFGNEETNSNYETCLTEEAFYNFKTLNQLSELCNLPFERDINELCIAFSEYNCTVSIDDEGGSTFQIKNDHENILKKICKYIYPIDNDYLYNLVINHKNNYICFNLENLEHKIYIDLQDLITNEFR